MSYTELTEEQKHRINEARLHMVKAVRLLSIVDDELYQLGSFVESPVGYTQHQLELSLEYSEDWVEKGVEIQ